MAIPRPVGSLAELLPSLSAVWDYLDAFIGGGAVAWASYTPTLTGLTLGNGTLTASWMKVGRTVYVRVHLLFGSSTSVSGAVRISLPATAVDYPGADGITAVGLARSYDGAAAFEGPVLMFDTTTVRIGVYNASGTYLQANDLTSAIPFTWGTGDELSAQFFYEAAA